MKHQRAIISRIRKYYSVGYGPACLYLLHFEKPFGHARHYLGFTGKPDVESRLTAHREGHGSALIRAALAAGIDFTMVLKMRVPLCLARTLERKLKNSGSGLRICPLCLTESRAKRATAKRLENQRKKERML